MTRLPIDDILPGIQAAFAEGENLVVVATPGAGKTTRVAPALLNAGLVPKGQKILMLQPRRLAAKAIAARIAEENNWQLGGPDVGYHVRFEKRLQKSTRLTVMTEGILARQLLADPALTDVACVVLDEFHERSLHTDLALALLLETQSVFKPDLRIIVMSATLDAEPLLKFLPRAKLWQAEGRVFPLSIIYQPKRERRDSAKRLEDQVSDALMYLISRDDDDGGNVLIFLPGIGEIRWCTDKLRADPKLKNFDILELHGSLTLEQQSTVLHAGQRRRIILSTNIAETSLTVPGVSNVIDSGLARVMRWNLARNVESLQLSRISLASAKQRAGRAARERPGRVYRLWSTDEERSFKEFEVPEIHRVDLAGTLLVLAMWGVSDFEKFRWFESPSPAKIQSALQELRGLRALSETNQLTDLGRQLARIPLPPRFALALQVAKNCDRVDEMALALAVLEQKDPVVNVGKLKSAAPAGRECDLSARAAALLAVRAGASPAAWGMSEAGTRTCIQVARDLAAVVETAVSAAGGAGLAKAGAHLGYRLWPAFADRLCRRRELGSSRAVMVGGAEVTVAGESEVATSEYFLAVEMRDTTKELKVNLASGLTLAEIKLLAGSDLVDENVSDIDLKSFRLKRTRRVRFRDLVIEGPYPATGREDIDSQALRESMHATILNEWATFGTRFPALGEFELRIRYAQKFMPELQIPELAADLKLSIAEAAVDFARHDSVDNIDMHGLLSGLYPPESLQLLNLHTPTRIRVPSERDIKLHYSADLQTVKCKVKLQELFGLTQSPAILRNKIQIVFDLLSPRERPLQTTSDLASFWRNTYPTVRAEMKIKYPRHPWPEDPLTAEATHKLAPRRPKK